MAEAAAAVPSEVGWDWVCGCGCGCVCWEALLADIVFSQILYVCTIHYVRLVRFGGSFCFLGVTFAKMS